MEKKKKKKKKKERKKRKKKYHQRKLRRKFVISRHRARLSFYSLSLQKKRYRIYYKKPYKNTLPNRRTDRIYKDTFLYQTEDRPHGCDSTVFT